MTFADLIWDSDWAAVKTCLFHTYPDSKLDSYERVFLELRHLTPQPETMRIVLETVVQGDEAYTDVSGCDGTLNKDVYPHYASGAEANTEVRYSLALTAWEKWLGMRVDKDSAFLFSQSEIITHCLWEMTFHGFEQDKIAAFSALLARKNQEVANMTPSEFAENFIPLEKIMNRLDLDKKIDPDSQ